MADSAGITIVGLGPGPESLWTLEARRSVELADEVWARTFRHPSGAALVALRPDARSFDDVYEQTAQLPSVYVRIVEGVLEAASRGSVCYAVPGSPSVGEASVVQLRHAARERGLSVYEVPGISFVEPTLAALGWDAFDGVQVADAMDLARRHHPPFDPDRPVLVAQAYSRVVVGDAKLVLLAQYPPEHPVVVVRSAGTPSEELDRVALAELDRADRFDDETTLAIPPLSCGRADRGDGPVGGSLQTLAEMMARLRSPTGCPWDLEQTHQSLAPFLLEEAHEVLEAIDNGDSGRLRDELGDLLLQVVFHAQIASESSMFTVHDVVCAVTDKIVARHPHVFGDEHAATAAEVERRWEDLKRRERAVIGDDHDPFEGIPTALPALARARQVQERAERIGVGKAVSTAQTVVLPTETISGGGAATLTARQMVETLVTEDQIASALWDIADRARSAGVDAEGALRRLTQQRIAVARAAALELAADNEEEAHT